MQKNITYIVAAILLIVIIGGKFYQNIFPQVAKGSFSVLNISVPNGWILAKDKSIKKQGFDFEMIIPSSKLAKPDGFMRGKNIKTDNIKNYIKDNKEKKIKSDKKFTKDSGYSELLETKGYFTFYICKYLVESKADNVSLETVEFVIYNNKNKTLWHIVGVFNSSYFNKKKQIISDFLNSLAKDNCGVTLKDIFGNKKILNETR